MRKMKVRIIWGVIIVAFAALLIFRMTRKGEPVAVTPAPVVTAENPHMGNIELTTNLIGTIEPADIVYIYPKAGGDVTAVNVKAGDVVSAGQVLLEIDTKQVASAKNAMDTARVAWDDARSTLDRMAPLHASGFVSDKEFEGYQTNAEAKRLQYEAAKIGYDNQMEFSHVTSPISGRVEQFNVEVHDTVGSSMQLCVIAGDSGNNVSFYVTEKVKNNLTQGTPIVVSKEGKEYPGTVIEVSSMAEASVGLFKIKASVEDNEQMAAGTTVELKVPSASEKNVMLIPTQCVYYKGGDAYVYTYDLGIIHEVPVEVGIFDKDYIIVTSGLTLEDQILTTWTSELKEGTKVTLEGEAPVTVSKDDEALKTSMTEESQGAEAESPAADQSQAQ
ncbi:MAG: efflux RND transporter periplasmic adaptor subunit [Clostridiaceae bacterium]|uniref:Efflux RND transporter periplasmic adaptor subunit n=1 Tax=Clostridium porci TaxID=2605778 RepID=A0A7X2NLF2_9CLOT|nr:efflux RND transporter periplasmic adaptor subunit [Clostridium porci]MDY3232777.1 efflux RND transporter periplasmic adaptor subunit [Clostridiaceae bacterium]MSS36860.1 efflux RND transporter periplasmic adaptor subunit [Clostridium porci]